MKVATPFLFNMKNVVIVHYNTPELLEAAIQSLNNHTFGCKVHVFDNSDKRPFTAKMKGVTVIDNTRGQIIDFEKELAKYPDKWERDKKKSNYGSAKHSMSVDKMMDILPEGFVLMDSDVIIKKNISCFWNKKVACVGSEEIKKGVPLLMPFLCYLNVPILKEKGIRFFNGKKMWALSNQEPNCHYDTGAWLLEEVRRYGLPVEYVNIWSFVSHLGHGSWREKDTKAWFAEHAEYLQEPIFENMNERAKIYVCGHTDFDLPVRHPVYEVIDARNIEAINGVRASFYCELLVYKWLAENGKLPNIVGCCQYRKYFDFMDDVPDLATKIKENGCITIKAREFGKSVYEQYAECHNAEDMDIALSIVEQNFPKIYPTMKRMLEGNKLYIGNMLIMKRADFKKLVAFVFGVLDKYLEQVGADIEKRIQDKKEGYLNKKGMNADADYQYKIGGFLGERLTSAWIMHNFPQHLEVEKRITSKRLS